MRLKPYIPVTIIFSILAITFAGLACTQEPDLSGIWKGSLKTDGGSASFNFVVKGTPGDFSGYVINSSDTLEFSTVVRQVDSLFLAFNANDARLEAELSPDERSLSGEWIRKDTRGSQNRVSFSAEKGTSKHD